MKLLVTAGIKLLQESLELRRPGIDAADQARLLRHVVDEGVKGLDVLDVVDRLDVEGASFTLLRKVKFVLPKKTFVVDVEYQSMELI